MKRDDKRHEVGTKSAGNEKAVATFDYSKLAPEFAGLSKPAQRALLNQKIATVADLATYSQDEVMALHGIGPSALPLLLRALSHAGLKFRPREKA